MRADGQDAAAATVEAQLRATTRNSGIGVIDVALGDAGGGIDWSALGQPQPASIADDPGFAALRGGARTLEVSGGDELRFLRPLPDEAGRSAGFAMVTVANMLALLAALGWRRCRTWRVVPLLARLADGAAGARACRRPATAADRRGNCWRRCGRRRPGTRGSCRRARPA